MEFVALLIKDQEGLALGTGFVLLAGQTVHIVIIAIFAIIASKAEMELM